MFIQDSIQLFRPSREKIKWKVPALCCNDWAAIRLLKICSKLSGISAFDIAYGAPNCAWSGGHHTVVNQTLSEAQLIDYVRTYKNSGAICAFTLSRLNVPKENLADQYCNLILDIIEEYGGEVIVYDDILAAYVRKAHPKIKTIASISKAKCCYKTGFEGFKDETAYYYSLLDKYDIVNVRADYALDNEQLDKLSDVSDHIEILVNDICKPGCTSVYAHLRAIEEWSDTGRHDFSQGCYYADTLSILENRLEQNQFISEPRISELVYLGFTRFKLAGRNIPPQKFLDMLARYIFEPTGTIFFIVNEIVNEFRTMENSGNGLAQCQLPC